MCAEMAVPLFLLLQQTSHHHLALFRLTILMLTFLDILLSHSDFFLLRS